MSDSDPAQAARTYGNWRRPSTPGLGSLGALGTAVLLAGLVGVVATVAAAGLAVALAVAVVTGLLLVLLVVRDRHHRTAAQRLTARIGWSRARRGGSHLYRSGPLGRTPGGTFLLPGLAAASELSEWTDDAGHPFALVRHPSTGHATVVLAAEPEGASLVDPEQVDVWVARWGAWLSALGSEPGLVATSVTVESAPDLGVRLRAEVTGHLDRRAPPAASAMLREVLETAPAGSATVSAFVALTFAASGRSGARRRGAREVAGDLGARLPALAAGLGATGVAAVRPMSADDLCRVVRVAYDPEAAPLLEEAAAEGEPTGLRWSDVGPAAAQAAWGWYRHDGALSVTWSMSAAPRGEVFSSVLGELLAPHPAIDRKRVTLVYRPVDTARAARLVEQERRNADFRVAGAARPTSRALLEQRAAALTAEEEARGAGLVAFALLVTATVARVDEVADPGAALDAVRTVVDDLAATARLQLRPVYGSQDSAFAAALPLGVVLPAHVRLPRELREGW